MANNLKKQLAAKLQENTQQHNDALRSIDFFERRVLKELDINSIQSNPYQPRFDAENQAITSLAESIQVHGLIQPILVRQIDNTYQLIAGERRLLACKQLGQQRIEAIICTETDEQTALLALEENLEREDISDYEIFQAIKQIEHLFKNKSHLANSIKVARQDLYRFLAFEQLPDVILLKLKSAPKLISRTTANELKQFFQQLTPAAQQLYPEILLSALAEMEQGKLNQANLKIYLQKQLTVQSSIPVDKPLIQARHLTTLGKVQGKFTRQQHKVSIHIQHLNQEQDQHLFKLVADFLHSASQNERA